MSQATGTIPPGGYADLQLQTAGPISADFAGQTLLATFTTTTGATASGSFVVGGTGVSGTPVPSSSGTGPAPAPAVAVTLGYTFGTTQNPNESEYTTAAINQLPAGTYPASAWPSNGGDAPTADSIANAAWNALNAGSYGGPGGFQLVVTGAQRSFYAAVVAASLLAWQAWAENFSEPEVVTVRLDAQGDLLALSGPGADAALTHLGGWSRMVENVLMETPIGLPGAGSYSAPVPQDLTSGG